MEINVDVVVKVDALAGRYGVRAKRTDRNRGIVSTCSFIQLELKELACRLRNLGFAARGQGGEDLTNRCV